MTTVTTSMTRSDNLSQYFKIDESDDSPLYTPLLRVYLLLRAKYFILNIRIYFTLRVCSTLVLRPRVDFATLTLTLGVCRTPTHIHK